MYQDYNYNVIPLENLSLADFDSSDGQGIVNLWVPEYSDMLLMAEITKSASEKKKPKLVDMGCGSGLISRLFADFNIDVLAVDHNRELLYQANKTYKHPNLQFLCVDYITDILNLDEEVDAIYCSFMPDTENWTPIMHKLKPNAILHVLHKHGEDYFTGNKDAYKTGIDYQICAMKPVYSHMDIEHLSRITVERLRSGIQAEVKKEVLPRVIESLKAEGDIFNKGVLGKEYSWEIELKKKAK